jgi:hypothetical protein
MTDEKSRVLSFKKDIGTLRSRRTNAIADIISCILILTGVAVLTFALIWAAIRIW